MNREINYSIIIPHKNIPDLLKRCLNSIPRRDDIQIIVVDDNSDSDKVDFEQFPGLNDPFVEVIFTKEGKGAGYARNVGMTKAAGKWTIFADADDFYNYCINDILDEYISREEDIVYFKHNSVDSDMYTSTKRLTHFCTNIDKWISSSKKYDSLLRYKNICVWSKFYRTDLIKKNGVVFDEVSVSNDVMFSYFSAYHAVSIYADPRALYCATIRKGSLRQKKLSIEMKLDDFYVACKSYIFRKKYKIANSGNLRRINSLVTYYFFNRNYFHRAMNIMLDLGFTKNKIFILCISNIFFYIPKLKILKLLSIPKKIVLKLVR
jgi:glycosyltransferase involved in cell wall biosynthesis